MSALGETVRNGPPRLIEGDHDFCSLTELVCGLVEQPARRWWWIAFVICAFFGVLGLVVTVDSVVTGQGIWGLNQSVGWGFDIASFMFWIGIGNAGALISASSLLLRQKWRCSLNRAAEAMAFFAVACAGCFVMIHLGRAWIFWYMLPAPSAVGMYPNYRSALSWDFVALSAGATVSLMFAYVGMIPDLATLRDRARSRLRQLVYGLLALGWRGSGRHWRNFQTAYLMLAGLTTAQVAAAQTIVSFDVATSVIPGWHSTLFPPYFVTGAILSGLAMLITLVAPLRGLCGFKEVITLRHLGNVCKLVIAMSLLVGYAYAVELYTAWYGGNIFEQYTFRNRVIGPYGWCFGVMFACNVLLPQLFWFRWFRTTPWAMFLIAALVNIGMWFERFVIVATSLTREHLPSSWKMFYPTGPDFLLLVGGFGLFASLFLLFVRFLPVIALSEVKGYLLAALGTDSDRLEGSHVMSAKGAFSPDQAGRLHGILARFAGPVELVDAIGRLHALGYDRLDAYSPFPIPGMDQALGLKRSNVPVLVLAGGCFGAVAAQTVQWYQSAIAYPLITAGKPFNSAEAFAPITVVTSILCAAFGAVFGMLAMNGLPRLYHPVFRSESFARTTSDGFFLSVEARDRLFEASVTEALVE
jgi:Ni/Fe-hydrogenase subunit HybB-like protein